MNEPVCKEKKIKSPYNIIYDKIIINFRFFGFYKINSMEDREGKVALKTYL
jgi:hypothetical protein